MSHPTMNGIPNLVFDEHQWVVQVRQTIDAEIEENIDIPVSIFNVPTGLMASKPDCYIPQQVALGPYHHWRPELYGMERYKLLAAKNAQKQIQILKFQHLVDHLANLEPRIRAFYHKYLDFSGETLAWIVAIDSFFLLEFLQVYAIKECRVLRRVISGMSHLFDIAGKKSAHNAILRDVIMLENQIPLFLLREVLEFKLSSLELADEMIHSLLLGMLKELCPFMIMEELPNVPVDDYAHLLDFLYQMVVPTSEENSEVCEAEEQDEGEQKSFSKFFFFSGLKSFLKRVIVSKPVKHISKLPWAIISNLPMFRILKQPIEHLSSMQHKAELYRENESNNNKPPLVEEISVPSITELAKAGVQFSPTKGGILTIAFDEKTSTFSLPVISLDMNSDTILRNLVAYEACHASGPLVFTRYTELMNGIIDTAGDAKLLRERGIIVNRLKSDEEVANMWNGMSRCVRLTKVPCLDKVIEDINKYYNNSWRVKFGRFIKLYVFNSWQFLTLLAAILLLFFMSLQVFSSMSRCARVFLVSRN